MPFENPQESAAFVSPLENGEYTVELLDVVDDEDRGFGPTLRWKMHVYDRAGEEQILGEDGEPFVLELLSAAKVTHNDEKKNSKAYDWASAFAGSPIHEVAATGDEILTAIVGQVALATVTHNERGFPVVSQTGMRAWEPPKPKPATRVAQRAAVPAAAKPAAPAAARGRPAFNADGEELTEDWAERIDEGV